MRVIGSHAMSTRPSELLSWNVLGDGMVDVMRRPFLGRWSQWSVGGTHQVRVAPVVSFLPGVRHLGSLSKVPVVMLRSRFIVWP